MYSRLCVRPIFDPDVLFNVYENSFEEDPDIVRLLLIQIAVKFQEETQLFFYQHIYEIPAFRLSNSQMIISWLERLIAMLVKPNEEDKKRLSQIIEEGMKFYMKEFAGKKYSSD